MYATMVEQQATQAEPQNASESRQELFVVPSRRGGGFQASIRGHLLELADPSSHVLAPTPDDLLVAAIASDLAWTARRFLGERRLSDEVSVSGAWRTHEGRPRLADIVMTVTVPRSSEAVSANLVAVLEDSVAARSLSAPPRVGIRISQGDDPIAV